MAIVFPYQLLGIAFASFFQVEKFRLPNWLPALGRTSQAPEG
jgi:hypothetical protein